MATLYVTEYGGTAGDTQIAREPPVASQTVSLSTTSAQSSAFNAATVFVRVHTDAVCSIAFSTNPTATQSLRRMAADQTEYFGVPPSASFKVAGITNT
jgi:hypothetical protein